MYHFLIIFSCCRLFFVLGAISIKSWYFIFVLGAIRRVKVDFSDLFLGYIALLAIAVIGSQIFEHFLIRKNKEEI